MNGVVGDMSERRKGESQSERQNEHLKRLIGRKAARKMVARKESKSVWFGLGMFGLIGWSVVIPTLLGLAFGIWLDNRFDHEISWTLTLFFAGLVLGCLNAWQWMNREGAVAHNNDSERDNKDE